MDAKEVSFAAALADLRQGDLRGRDVILAWLERRGIPVRDREDLAQEVLLGAITSWGRYDPASYPAPPHRAPGMRGTKPRSGEAGRAPRQRAPRESLRRWLHGITSHVVARYLDDKCRHFEEASAEPVAVDIADERATTPDAALEQRATRAELSAAVLLLPALHRLAAMSTIKALAERTGQQIQALYRVRYRAYAALAALLAEDPIGQWRARVAALEMARRVLRLHGLSDSDARALVRIAADQPGVTEADVWRRALDIGLAGTAAGPLALAALAAREATDAEGQCARDLVQLAIDAAAVGVARLRRAYGGSRGA